MKNHAQDGHDPAPESDAKSKLPAKPREMNAADGALRKSINATKTGAGQAEPSDILKQEQLSHPANAGQLAGILGELQQSHGNAYVQRVVSEMSEAHLAVETQESGGQKLDDGVRAEMEAAFGENFGDVQVHTGKPAGDASEQLGARAFTRGREIYFNEGEYDPSTNKGKSLIAHELTHVIQQKGAAASNERSSVGQAHDSFEVEADRAASAVLRGEQPIVVQRGATPAYQRQGQQQPRPQPQPQPQQADAGSYVPRVDLPAQDLAARLGPHARFIYRYNPQSNNYNLIVLISRPLQFNSMMSTIDATFESIPEPGGEMLNFNVVGRRGSPIFLRIRLTSGRRNIDIRFNFPVRL